MRPQATVKKESVIESFRNLPEVVIVDDLIERIIVIAKIENALAQAAAGNIDTNERVFEEAKQWLKR